MPHEFAVEQADRLLLVRYTGEVGVRERQDVIVKLMDQARATGFHRMLIDFRNAHSKPADPRDVLRVVDHYAPRMPVDTRLAYLLRYDHQLDDTFEVFARERGIQVERFTDRGMAMAWLDAAASGPAHSGPTRPGPGVAHALRLATDAIGDGHALRTDQVAAIDALVHVLLATGIDEATIRDLAGRIAAAMAPGPG